MKPITVWYRKSKSGNFEHNHIEDGHCTLETPTPKFIIQNHWKNENWVKEFAYLKDNIIIRETHEASDN